MARSEIQNSDAVPREPPSQGLPQTVGVWTDALCTGSNVGVPAGRLAIKTDGFAETGDA